MKKLFILALATITVLTVSCSKSKGPGISDYYIGDLQSTTALAGIDLNLESTDGAEYTVSLCSDAAAAQNPENMGTLLDVYNKEMVSWQFTGLTSGTDYYSCAFLKYNGKLYTSKVLHFKTR